MGNIQSLAFPVPPISGINYKHKYVTTYKLNQIPIVHINNYPDAHTIIYSHGNATDLGRSIDLLIYMSKTYKVNIIGYEYLGYGKWITSDVNLNCSTGNSSYPSEDGCYESLFTIYEYAINKLKIPNKKIILMGQSLGSGATIDIGSKVSSAGIILLSPFKSAATVITESYIGYLFDFFRNIDKIHLIKSDILLIHGINDDIIHYSHSQQLAKKNNRSKLILVPLAKHNDIITFDDCKTSIIKFIDNLSISE
jgi:fermentation-respiration switch protein FrsA (DUF1100 family)